MSTLLIALSAAAASATPAMTDHVHRQSVEHRGQTVELSYRPHVTVATKTIGMAAGTRMSTERCRWTAHVHVARHIAMAGGQDMANVLPGTRTFEQSQPGTCRQAARAVEQAVAARSDVVRDHVAAVAAADRSAALAAIDQSRTLAAN